MKRVDDILNSLDSTKPLYEMWNSDFTNKVMNRINSEAVVKKLTFYDYMKIAAVALIVFGNVFFLSKFLGNLSNTTEEAKYEQIASDYSLSYIYPDYIYNSNN